MKLILHLLFYFILIKKNKNYINQNHGVFIYIPLFIVIVYLIIGIFSLKTAVNFRVAAASGIHVTRQSIGIQRIYGEARNNFYEYLVYFSSFVFLIIGFYRFYLEELLNLINLNVNLIDIQQTNYKIFFVIFLFFLSLLDFLKRLISKKNSLI